MQRTTFANTSLIALSLFYLIMLGGGNYEVINVGSKLMSAPPQSFSMLQGPYGFNPVKFWVIFRPITIILFVVTLITNWRHSPPRRYLLIAGFVIDLIITLSTFLYFAPEIGEIVSAPFSNTVDPVLLKRALRWERLNFVRLGAFYLVSLLLLISLTIQNAGRDSLRPS